MLVFCSVGEEKYEGVKFKLNKILEKLLNFGQNPFVNISEFMHIG